VSAGVARGRFISFEGGEGAGKSTQVARLAERLRARGLEVVTTREPGGTPGAETIRTLLVQGEPDRWSARTEALLVNAARADHVERLIRPALERGAWVITDRYADSTLAYQGAAGRVVLDDLRVLHRLATEDLWPDLTLILDLAVDVALPRALARSGADSRFEAHAAEFHDRVRGGFRAVAEQDRGRCRLIDAGASVDEVADRVWHHVETLCS
jgi:dTMP kinase